MSEEQIASSSSSSTSSQAANGGLVSSQSVGSGHEQHASSDAARSLAGPADRLLTLVIPGRNDAYMGDFKWRLGTCLDYLARNLKQAGRLHDVEVLICDWNSEVPLHHVLELTPDAAEIVRFVVVPPKFAVPAQQDSPFPIPIAQNVAIRRARGEFIAQTDSEILYTPSTVRALLNVLDGTVLTGVDNKRALLVSGRRHLPFQWAMRRPSLDEIDSFLNRNAGLAMKEPLFAGLATPSAMALMHRSVWLECGGYDERFIYWGWMEIDLYLRVTQRHPWRTLDNYGVNLVHIEHYKTGRQGGQTRRENPTPVSMQYEANDSMWGMAGLELEIQPTLQVRSPHAADEPALVDDVQISVSQLQEQFRDPELTTIVDQHLSATSSFMTPRGPEERLGLLALAWHAKYMNPRTFFEFGCRVPFAAGLVTRFAPAVEVYGTDNWLPADGWPVIPPFAVPNFLRGCNYHGYCRVITGDPATVVQRWWDSTHQLVDLALVRAEMPGGFVTEQALELLKHLAPGGAMVVISRSPQAFQTLFGAIRSQSEGRINVEFSEKLAGMVLAARFSDAAR
jgi:hypothetical protein